MPVLVTLASLISTASAVHHLQLVFSMARLMVPVGLRLPTAPHQSTIQHSTRVRGEVPCTATTYLHRTPARPLPPERLARVTDVCLQWREGGG
ncbi:hypothetical protein M3J07_006459 [Ascochyta lentis]